MQGLICELRSVCLGLEQGQDPACFSVGSEMQAEKFLGGLNKGRRHLSSGAESELWVQDCLLGLEQGQDPDWCRAGTEMRAQEYLSRSGQGQDPAWFSAGAEMWAQECFSGL